MTKKGWRHRWLYIFFKFFMDTNWIDNVDFKRVCQLNVDDRFMWQGIFFRVNVIDKTGIWYDSASRKSKVTKKSALQRLGLNNQMFVQVIKQVK